MLSGEQYEVIDAEKNPDMAQKFGILQAPTLVVIRDGKVQKYVNASNIQKYMDQK